MVIEFMITDMNCKNELELAAVVVPKMPLWPNKVWTRGKIGCYRDILIDFNHIRFRLFEVLFREHILHFLYDCTKQTRHTGPP
jgi:hypothetical protein